MWIILNHLDQNTTLSFEAEPECALNHLIAIVLYTAAVQQLKCHIIWIIEFCHLCASVLQRMSCLGVSSAKWYRHLGHVWEGELRIRISCVIEWFGGFWDYFKRNNINVPMISPSFVRKPALEVWILQGCWASWLLPTRNEYRFFPSLFKHLFCCENNSGRLWFENSLVPNQRRNS